MSKRTSDAPITDNLTGLAPSAADANRSQQAAAAQAQPPGEALTTNQGLLIGDNQNSLRAGERGPTLLEDHILREKITEKYPGAVIAGMYSPPFRSLTADEDAEIVEKINAAKPDFVWVGLGAPKQERWMAAHENRVQALMLGVGAAFDYEAGNIRRAPAWMQRCNLEWLYRLMQDPKRLFKRYFVTNTKFLWWSWRH